MSKTEERKDRRVQYSVDEYMNLIEATAKSIDKSVRALDPRIAMQALLTSLFRTQNGQFDTCESCDYYKEQASGDTICVGAVTMCPHLRNDLIVVTNDLLDDPHPLREGISINQVVAQIDGFKATRSERGVPNNLKGKIVMPKIQGGNPAPSDNPTPADGDTPTPADGDTPTPAGGEGGATS